MAPSVVSIGRVVSEEKSFEKLLTTDDDGRQRTTSNDNSWHITVAFSLYHDKELMPLNIILPYTYIFFYAMNIFIVIIAQLIS